MKSSLEGLSEIDQCVLEALDSLEGRCKYCAKSALVHLEKAERLIDLDAEMTIFRAITSEEEAAAGVFFAIRQRGYPKAEFLNPRDHVHKNAVIPFLFAISDFMLNVKPQPTELIVRFVKAEKRITLNYLTPEGKYAEPVPPLNFSIVAQADEKPAWFLAELEGLAEAAGKTSLKKYLSDTANVRNQILYADDDGVPRVTGDLKKSLEFARWKVFVLLRAMCLIFPYPEHALFVRQAVDGFLLAVGSIKEADLEW